MRQIIHDWADDIGIGVGLGRSAAKLLVKPVKGFGAFLLVVERLDYLLTGHHLFDIAVDVCDGLLLTGEIAAALFADYLDRVEHDKAHDGYDCEQLERQDKHHQYHAHKRCAGDDKLGYAVVQKLANSVDIVRIVAHQLAVRVRVKILDGQTLHTVEHILPQLAQHLGGADEHQVVKQIVRHHSGEVQECHAYGQGEVPCVLLRLDDAGLLQHRHQRLHHERSPDGGSGVQQNGDHRHDEHPAAVLVVGKDPSEGLEGIIGLAFALEACGYLFLISHL